MSEVIQTHIQLWRRKVQDGSITTDEMRQAIAAIRQDRVGASKVSAASGAKKAAVKAKAVPINSDDLLGELGI